MFNQEAVGAPPPPPPFLSGTPSPIFPLLIYFTPDFPPAPYTTGCTHKGCQFMGAGGIGSPPLLGVGIVVSPCANLWGGGVSMVITDRWDIIRMVGGVSGSEQSTLLSPHNLGSGASSQVFCARLDVLDRIEESMLPPLCTLSLVP